jgi:DNA topoisomerase-3
LIDNIEFTGKYKPTPSDPVDDKNRITDKSYIDNIGRLILNKQFTITSLKTTTKETPAPLPFNMATALAAINRLYKLPLPKIDAALQDLRLKHNLITYSRSDCRYLSEAIFENVPYVLASVGANDPDLATMVANTNSKFKSRAVNNSKAGVHHGIIPTSHKTDLSRLTKVEYDIYILICRSFIAQFMPLHKYNHTKVTLDVQGYTFEATSKKVLVNGWKDVFFAAELNDEDTEEEEQAVTLQDIVSNSGLCKAYLIADKATAPKKKYNVASLILDMNSVAKYCKDPKIKSLLLEKDKDNDELHGSIGTSATQKEIVPAQFDKGMFIEDKKGNLTSTQICRDLFDMLPEKITNPDITALWFEQQELVAQGKLSINEFIANGYKFIAEQVNAIKNMKVALNIDVYKCLSCNETLKRAKSQYGYYWYCNDYKNGCSFKAKDDKGKPILDTQKNAPKQTGDKCPDCGDDLVTKKGKWSDFISCNSYPKCKWTPPKAEKPKVEATGKKCEKCGSDMVKRKSKDGTGEFLACSGFPKCKNIQSVYYLENISK